MELKGIKSYGTVEAKVRSVVESIGEDVNTSSMKLV